ncbi:hypothetical protein B2J93_4117 [Marssonina coronariae]|uniref:Uncharacterized protein n=1 Tax=Diplocarpon coronariae TaxID=2795749 RepID=A0A218ZC30_9HELO|nr:hypothetical protein B2J93_4117 [Marssonina coronariae]
MVTAGTDADQVGGMEMSNPYSAHLVRFPWERGVCKDHELPGEAKGHSICEGLREAEGLCRRAARKIGLDTLFLELREIGPRRSGATLAPENTDDHTSGGET